MNTTADEQHAQYFNDNPRGNHVVMSQETRLAIGYIQDDLKKILERVAPIEKMKYTQETILEQVQQTNVRVTKLEQYRQKIESSIEEMIEEKKAKKVWIREHIWKLLALSAGGAFGFDKIISII